jgi:hypothetical protein
MQIGLVSAKKTEQALSIAFGYCVDDFGFGEGAGFRHGRSLLSPGQVKGKGLICQLKI